MLFNTTTLSSVCFSILHTTTKKKKKTIIQNLERLNKRTFVRVVQVVDMSPAEVSDDVHDSRRGVWAHVQLVAEGVSEARGDKGGGDEGHVESGSEGTDDVGRGDVLLAQDGEHPAGHLSAD